MQLIYTSGMHGRGSQASAPASDAVGRGDAGGTPQTTHLCRIVPRGDSWIGPTWADAAQIGPTRSVSTVSFCISRNSRVRPKFKKKKKKGAKRTVWLNLNTQTLTRHPKLPNTLSHSVPHLPSLCAPSLISLLCVLSSLWVLCAHCTASAFSVLSLLFSWIFILCSLRFLSFKLLRNEFVNLKIYVLDCLLCFFACFFNSCGS